MHGRRFGTVERHQQRDDEFGRLQSTPAALGGTTQSPYIVISDADEVYRRAKAAGAEIVIEIKDEDYGGRVFSCRDPGRRRRRPRPLNPRHRWSSANRARNSASLLGNSDTSISAPRTSFAFAVCSYSPWTPRRSPCSSRTCGRGAWAIRCSLSPTGRRGSSKFWKPRRRHGSDVIRQAKLRSRWRGLS